MKPPPNGPLHKDKGDIWPQLKRLMGYPTNGRMQA